jgi:RNA polymerase sigma-70 factor (ECF subfamily)
MDPSWVLPIDHPSRLASNESTLIAAARQEPAAFGVLHDRYVARVYRYLRARTDNEDDAADLTQQVFLQALAALPKYRERGLPFAAWLFRIAHNVATDAKRRKPPLVGWAEIPERQHPRTEDDVEALVIQREAVDRLRVLLARLDATQREVVTLRFMAELSAREIAAVLGKSEATIYRQLTSALQTLKEQYDDP